MHIFSIIKLFVSLSVLAVIAEHFIRILIKLCQQTKASTFIVSIIIGAIGTSIPELFTSLQAIIERNSDLVMGNVMGSNIINLTLCLALGTIPRVIHIKQSHLLERSNYFFVIINLICLIFLWSSIAINNTLYLTIILLISGLLIYQLHYYNGKHTSTLIIFYLVIVFLHFIINILVNYSFHIFTDNIFNHTNINTGMLLTYKLPVLPGILLICLLPVWIVIIYNLQRSNNTQRTSPLRSGNLAKSPSDFIIICYWLFLLLIFPVIIMFFARIVVLESIAIITYFNLNSAAFSAVIIALGTNMPEILTTITASRLRHPNIILGHIIGSNIFNNFILSIAFLSGDGTINSKTMMDLDMMIMYSLVFVLLLMNVRCIDRKIAYGALSAYVVFTVIQILSL